MLTLCLNRQMPVQLARHHLRLTDAIDSDKAARPQLHIEWQVADLVLVRCHKPDQAALRLLLAVHQPNARHLYRRAQLVRCTDDVLAKYSTILLARRSVVLQHRRHERRVNEPMQQAVSRALTPRVR